MAGDYSVEWGKLADLRGFLRGFSAQSPAKMAGKCGELAGKFWENVGKIWEKLGNFGEILISGGVGGLAGVGILSGWADFPPGRGGGMEKICKALDRAGGGGDTAGMRGLQAGNVSHTAIGAPDCPGDFVGGARKVSDAARKRGVTE